MLILLVIIIIIIARERNILGLISYMFFTFLLTFKLMYYEKILLTLTLLIGTMSFANTVSASDDNYHWIDVTTSCGINVVVICEDGDTIADVVEMAEAYCY